ncbi:cellulose synthase/poly-beta-1,6-N-acetylglucosamine synthase-like glycosyltransferase [Streptomyces sp. V4I8]|uniref:glycosyltransferase n=1 Tax=Streptomyces sp. V4I8 TaxID=3156469 RepID=UPI003514F603
MTILGLWLCLLALFIWQFEPETHRAFAQSTAIGVTVVASGLFISYFWLNGIKDLLYTLAFHRYRDQLQPKVPAQTRADGNWPRTILVYCTCDDFCAESLEASMRQDAPMVTTVILDDSKTDEFRRQVDEFAADHGVEVIRRTDRVGFKAGNLNNFLRQADFDYFVILDSDEIIPPNFVTRCLDYFEHYPNAGIVQANHVATRNRNTFMRRFHPGVASHWLAYQCVKNRFGFLSLLGHGAMVSASCYRAAGGFPHLVAEDLCFSIEARAAGYLTVFAPDIVCEEEFPVSYLAFKRRHNKWTQGNMEFIKKYTWRILSSPMRWFEKMDIVMFSYSLPLTSLFSLYVVINVIVLPALNYSVHWPLWMLVPTVLFIVAPMLNDILSLRKTMRAGALSSYLLHTVLLFGSMFFTSLRASFKSLFGSSVFLVTPKQGTRVTWRHAVRSNWPDLLFAVALTATCLWFTHSVLPVLLITVPTTAALYLARMHMRGNQQVEAGR